MGFADILSAKDGRRVHDRRQSFGGHTASAADTSGGQGEEGLCQITKWEYKRGPYEFIRELCCCSVMLPWSSDGFHVVLRGPHCSFILKRAWVSYFASTGSLGSRVISLIVPADWLAAIYTNSRSHQCIRILYRSYSCASSQHAQFGPGFIGPQQRLAQPHRAYHAARSSYSISPSSIALDSRCTTNHHLLISRVPPCGREVRIEHLLLIGRVVVLDHGSSGH